MIVRLISLLLVPLMSGLLMAGCQEQPAASQSPLIRIDGETISKQAFLQEFNQTLHPDQQLNAVELQELQRAYLVQLIDQRLIQAEAARHGIEVTPSELEEALATYRNEYPKGGFDAMLQDRGLTMDAWQAELVQSLTMEKLLEQVVYAGIEISEMEIAAYYEAHREEFNRPQQVRARQIMVADVAEGQRLLGLLRQGEDFATLAKAHSLSPDAEQGGDLGFFGRGDMPTVFDEVVFDLPVGRLSDLVQSEYGYHIFLVEEKRKAAHLGRAEASPEIQTTLENQKREALYQEWLQALRSQASIEVDWNQLEPAAQK